MALLVGLADDHVKKEVLAHDKFENMSQEQTISTAEIREHALLRSFSNVRPPAKAASAETPQNSSEI